MSRWPRVPQWVASLPDTDQRPRLCTRGGGAGAPLAGVTPPQHVQSLGVLPCSCLATVFPRTLQIHRHHESSWSPDAVAPEDAHGNAAGTDTPETDQRPHTAPGKGTHIALGG